MDMNPATPLIRTLRVAADEKGHTVNYLFQRRDHC